MQRKKESVFWIAVVLNGLATVILVVDQELVAGWGAVLFFWFILMILVASRTGFFYRKRFQKIKAFKMPMEVKVEDEGITYTSAHSQSKLLWSAFEKWLESGKNFLMYTQPNLFFIVPKRALSEEQISAFRDLLRSRIANQP